MEESELYDVAFAGLSSEYREHLLADIALDNPDRSLYGWAEFLPPDIRSLWPRLGKSQRVIAYLMAAASDC